MRVKSEVATLLLRHENNAALFKKSIRVMSHP